jgi:hypothetical protein
MPVATSVRLLALAFLAAALAGCTIVFEMFDETGDRHAETVRSGLIRQFVPTRGTGSTYSVGDPISFQVRTVEDGYITLTAIDPDGSVYVFARNIPVRGGRVEVISGLSPRQRFVITPPTGLHRVSAHFTPFATNERVQFRGVVGYDSWQAQIRIELQPFPRSDVVETRFFVRR